MHTHCTQQQETCLNTCTNLLAKRSSLSNNVQEHVAYDVAHDNDRLQKLPPLINRAALVVLTRHRDRPAHIIIDEWR